MGAAGLICLSGQVDPYDPEVVRASMGGAALLPMVRASPEALSAWARRHDAQLVAADAGAEERFDTFVWPRRTVLVLGEERRGVSGRVARTCTRQVAIPIVGTGNSLNVAVAAGVLLYAAWSARRN